MTDKPVDLDQHRGMAAQKATDLRRLLTEVAANEQALRATQDALEAQLIAAPASTWEEAADKVRCPYDPYDDRHRRPADNLRKVTVPCDC
jgi:hypothetical protein